MLRYVGVSAFAFLTGFYTHSLVMTPPPPVLVEQAQKMRELQSQFTENATNTAQEVNLSIVTTEFDGKYFYPPSIVVPVNRFISITNRSNSVQMKLISENNDLETIRGYAYTERLFKQLYDRGEYVVYVEGVPTAKLTVRVE
jgi:hypothetical protein